MILDIKSLRNAYRTSSSQPSRSAAEADDISLIPDTNSVEGSMENAGDFNYPPITNPPQQIFGDHTQNLSPILPNFGFGDDGDDDPNDDGGQGGGNDSKRRRIARVYQATRLCPRVMLTVRQACDMCRKKKIKCDGGMPACKNCLNYKTECIFTQVEKKRNPPKG